MATNYPSHWWSFAIAGCIFVLFILCIYWCITRRNRNSNSQYTPIDQAIYNEENVTNIDRNKNINRNQSRPSSRRSSFAFKKLLRLNEDGMLFCKIEINYIKLNEIKYREFGGWI